MGIADKDYFLDKDRNLATSDADAAFLLIRKGKEIPKDMAEKYGIGKVAQEAEGDGETVEKATKPASNKAKKPASNKGVK